MQLQYSKAVGYLQIDVQTLPAVFLGLYTNWFNRWALLIGWIVSMVPGTLMFIGAGFLEQFLQLEKGIPISCCSNCF